LIAHTLVIQTVEMTERRMVEQLRSRKVDAGLYSIGGAPTAQAWKELDDKYPPPWDIAYSLIGNHYGGERCVVDLGPGSGQACLAAIGPFLEHIRKSSRRAEATYYLGLHSLVACGVEPAYQHTFASVSPIRNLRQ
jgi:hypothetical protein